MPETLVKSSDNSLKSESIASPLANDEKLSVDPFFLSEDEIDPPLQPSETAEDAIDNFDKADEQNRYTDLEILGRSYKVRRAVMEAGTKSVKTWQMLIAKFLNTLDSPGKTIKAFAKNRAEVSYERKNTRLLEARSERLKNRRQASANIAKRKLEHRAANLQEHTERMENRIKAVHEEAASRHKEYISNLKAKKESGLARKALRSQLRVEGASRRETKSIIAEISKEHIGRVGKLASLHETSRRQTETGAKLENKAIRKQNQLDDGIFDSSELVESYSAELFHAKDRANRIQTNELPAAQQRFKELESELAPLEKTDPSYAELAISAQAARDRIGSLNRDLSYWNNVAAGSLVKSNEAREERRHLQAKRIGHLIILASLSKQTEQKKTIENTNKNWLDSEVSRTLNAA